MMRVKDADIGDIPVVLVANKVDLEDEYEVSFEEAAAKAEDLGCPLICASAKTPTNVTESFYELVRTDRLKRPQGGKQKKIAVQTRRPNLAKLTKGVCPIL
jgi:GTPase SAR1 family protein